MARLLVILLLAVPLLGQDAAAVRPRDLRVEASEIVMAEAVITKSGCVRDLGLEARSQHAQLSSSALLAFSKWKFKPATLDGQPVDVILKVTVHLRPN